jgi:hypothetical protein
LFAGFISAFGWQFGGNSYRKTLQKYLSGNLPMPLGDFDSLLALRQIMVYGRRIPCSTTIGIRSMASIENRSRYQVLVKNRDDLTKTFAHSSKTKAEEYCQSLAAQKL